MSIDTTTPASNSTVYLGGRVPTSMPATDPFPLEKTEERGYLVELHKYGDIDDVGQVGSHHYEAIYATVTGACAIRIRVDGEESLRATQPVSHYRARLVPQDARDRFAQRILDLHVEDGDSR